MAIIQVKNLSFSYEGSAETVFSGLDFHMDSSWRLGLVGRNGRGKTTLLRLLAGQLQGQGEVLASLPLDYFPMQIARQRPALEALVDAVWPYTACEQQMEELLLEGSPKALAAYGEALSAYLAHDGYSARELLCREAALMGIDPGGLSRPFDSFSPGEQTRLMVAALFMRPGRFLLVDEPTNHLDAPTRDRMAEYLRGKSGFLVVSHDRDFLDSVCDHILGLEKQGARMVAGNYSAYIADKRRQDSLERARRERITQDIARLRGSAREKAAWSDRVEAGKIGQGVYDRGYVGAQSAKMMKRAKAIEGRIARQIGEKEGLLKNLEYTAPITMAPLPHDSPRLLRLDQVSFSFGDREIIPPLDLALAQGERLAIQGPNGSGKTTLLRLIAGDLAPGSGSIWRASGLVISVLPQTSLHLRGTPRELARARGLDQTRFLTFLRKFDLPREAFEQEASLLSLGQRKKVLLSLSLAAPAHLYLWDEPLNDIDPESREQIEEMLEATPATLVFIEHERAFVRKIATRSISLKA